MNSLLRAVGAIGLAILSSSTLWYCLTAICCTAILGGQIREGFRLASRYLVTASVLSGLRSPADLRYARRRLGARGALGGLADGRHLPRHAVTEREMENLDRDIEHGYFPPERSPRRRPPVDTDL